MNGIQLIEQLPRFDASHRCIKLFPNDNYLDLIKFKAFADDKSNLAKIIISLLPMKENIVGKGENAGDLHFLPFPTMLSKGGFLSFIKSRDCVVKS